MTSAVLASRAALTRRPVAAATLACVFVAAAALVLPINVTYDGWGWLVWGREITHGTLDTTGGPSWKPLPVIPAVLVAGLGSLAPAAWLVLSRAVGLMAIVAVYRLAARWGGRLAGVVAAAALVLTPDVESQFVRLVFEGHIEAVTVTLALWAIERHLDGHRTQALLLCTAVALSRPEAWPFLGAYAAWLWWRAEAPRWLIVLALVTVPTLWFGGDWWGSGDWWHGADVAQVSSGNALRRLGRAAERAVEMVPWPLWIAAGVTVVVAWRRRQREQLALIAIAFVWTVLVITMSVAFRFAALGRFFSVAAAITCICAGLGVATIVEEVRRRRQWALVVAALLVASRAVHLAAGADPQSIHRGDGRASPLRARPRRRHRVGRWPRRDAGLWLGGDRQLRAGRTRAAGAGVEARREVVRSVVRRPAAPGRRRSPTRLTSRRSTVDHGRGAGTGPHAGVVGVRHRVLGKVNSLW